MMFAKGGGEGSTPKADAVGKRYKGGCVKMQTEGGIIHFADIMCSWPLIARSEEGSDCKTSTRLNASEVVSQQGGVLAAAVAVGVAPQHVEGAQLFEGDPPDVLEDRPDHVLGAGWGRQRSAVPEIVKITMTLNLRMKVA